MGILGSVSASSRGGPGSPTRHPRWGGGGGTPPPVKKEWAGRAGWERLRPRFAAAKQRRGEESALVRGGPGSPTAPALGWRRWGPAASARKTGGMSRTATAGWAGWAGRARQHGSACGQASLRPSNAAAKRQRQFALGNYSRLSSVISHQSSVVVETDDLGLTTVLPQRQCKKMGRNGQDGGSGGHQHQHR
jgi:hypothetical protein